MSCLNKLGMFLAVIFFVVGQSCGQEWTTDQNVQYHLSDVATLAQAPTVYPADANLGCCSTCQFQGHAQSWQRSANCAQSCQCSRETCQTNCGNCFNKRCHTCPAPSFARPFGESVNCALNCQVQNGVTAQLAFYVNDFYIHPTTNSWELTESGIRNFEKIVCVLPLSPCSVIVQSTQDPIQDELRRQKIVELMTVRGAIISPDRVVVGRPRIAGISGAEAQMIYSRSFEPRQLQGLDTTYFSPFAPGLSPGVENGNGQTR